MLFSSWPFIAVFLPVTLLVFRVLQKHATREITLLWLVSASLFFYGWFKPVYLLIVMISMACNYALGMMLAQKPWPQAKRRQLLIAGIAANLAALFYYKYTGLFFRTLNMAGGHLDLPDIILPLGISFFTFQKIAWLVDSYRKETAEPNFLHYALFISFFPQLIAGPITHHKEILPQFLRKPDPARARRLFAMGVTVFIIGLFKKVVIADGMGEIADPIFTSASIGNPLTFIESWLGAVAYTLQIYFDFSGYSDMAAGLAGMFGVRLPLNFFSPYKSADIVEFWRRWHITLSRFLRDYLYIPLGGNRRGKARRYVNLLVTMLLGGLWHGANWTFVIWGGLHGLYLVINHAYRALSGFRLPRYLATALTFLSVLAAWIFFRADSAATAWHVLSCMTGKYGLALQDTGGWLAKTFRTLGFEVQSVGLSRNLRINEKWYLLWLALALVFAAPNAHEIMRGRLALDTTGVMEKAASRPGRRGAWRNTLIPAWRNILIPAWRPGAGWAAGMALLAAASLLMLTKVNSFIYYQF